MKRVLWMLFIAAFISSSCFAEDISKEKALEIGEKVCSENGWKWEDVNISEHEDEKEKVWIINTNSNAQGSNAMIIIDKKTGRVLRKGYQPY